MESGRASKRRKVSLANDKLGPGELATLKTPTTTSVVKNGLATKSSKRKSKILVEVDQGVSEQEEQIGGDESLENRREEPEDNEEDEEQESIIRSSGRQRRRPKRYESDDGATIILTPAKTRQKQANKAPVKRTPTKTPPDTRPNPKKTVRPRKVTRNPEKTEAEDVVPVIALDIDTRAVELADAEETVLGEKDVWDVPPSPRRTVPLMNGHVSPEEAEEAEEGKTDAEEEEKTVIEEEEEEREEVSAAQWPQDMSQHAAIKGIVLEKLVGKRATRLIGLGEEYQKLHRVVEQTVTAGEGNSLLLIGARGTGKTALINSVLTEVAKENRDNFHTIRLNGFLQTDDKTALREIWRQLGKEMEMEDDNQVMNYADTLSTLLATLSHTSELPSAEQADAETVAKSVIFILDEFDMFASHARQTLLYNLFDIAQSRKAPIAVVGVTTRVDISESLEKRVKSRFSHRYIHLGLPKTLQSFQEIYQSVLQVHVDELHFDERAMLSVTRDEERLDSLGAWNSSIDGLFKSRAFIRHASRIYYTTKSIPEALTAAYLPVAMLDRTTPFLSGSAFTQSNALGPPDSKLYLLPSLPTLSLALLIVAARLDVILDSDLCNFNMAYDEYSSLAARARVSASAAMGRAGIAAKVWGKEVAKGAWERLVDLKLLMPTTALGGTGGLSSNDMMRCEVALEEIVGAAGELDRELDRWCREI